MAKTTPWTKIKAEYLQGATPKELALKYKIKAKTISEKACKEKWTAEKAKICKNLQKTIKDKIDSFTNNALEILNAVMNDPESKNADKVSAAKAILDISGLKNLKQDVKENELPTININGVKI